MPSAPNCETVLADVYCEGGTDTDFVRFWHGANPTVVTGKKLGNDQELATADPGSLQFTQGTGTATLRVEYYYYANHA